MNKPFSPITFIIIGLLYVALLLFLLCSILQQDTPANVRIVVNPPVLDGLVAILRGHPHAKQICYDAKLNGYFLQYEPLKDGAKDDNILHGWFLLTNVKFMQSSNKAWFIGTQPEENYVTVWPDVTNLVCKNQLQQ